MSLTRRQPLKRTARLSPVSAKRKAEMAESAKLRLAFLILNPLCRVWLDDAGWSGPAAVTGYYLKAGGLVATSAELAELGCPASEEVHHTKGRHGKNYLDTRTWIAVSRPAHLRIHLFPSEARRQGWLK